MSLLIIAQDDDRAVLVSDTLVSTPDGEPIGFQQKVWPIPHLNMAIACTGTANVAQVWHHWITNTPGMVDINTIDGVAPTVLPEIYAAVEREQGHVGRTTIYHVGFPAGSDRLVRYVYQSKDGFETATFEGAQPVIYAKPSPPGMDLEYPATVAAYVALAAQLRDENYRRLGDGGVPSGGELYATFLENWKVSTERWHRFDDYDAQLHTILGAGGES